MPRETPISLITLPGWQLGLNSDADPYQLELSEVPECQNVDFGLRGAITKRKGYTAWSVTGMTAMRSLSVWKEIGGSDEFVAVIADGSVFTGAADPLTDSTLGLGSASGTHDYPIGVASLNDKLYLTALSATNPISWDGTTAASVTATIFDGTASRFPKAAHLATHHDRIFAANIENAGTRKPSRVYWSTALTPETWPSTNFIDFDPDDGQEITAMAAMGESLIIFKNHGTQVLTGKSEDSFARYVVDPQIGCEAPGTVVVEGGFMFFFDPSTGVWQFDGASFEPLDTKINNRILDNLTWGSRHKSHAFIWRGRYYLSIPWGSDTYPSRTFVLDLRTRAWTEYTYGVTATAVSSNVLYGASPNNTSGIFTLETGLDDNGSAYTASFKTAWMAPQDSPSQKHRLRRLDTIWTALGNHNVDIYMYRNFNNGSTVATQQVNTDPGGAVYGTAVYGVDVYGSGKDEVFSRTTGWGNTRWRVIQFEVFVDSTTEDFQLNRMALIVSSLERVRGEN